VSVHDTGVYFFNLGNNTADDTKQGIFPSSPFYTGITASSTCVVVANDANNTVFVYQPDRSANMTQWNFTVNYMALPITMTIEEVSGYLWVQTVVGYIYAFDLITGFSVTSEFATASYLTSGDGYLIGLFSNTTLSVRGQSYGFNIIGTIDAVPSPCMVKGMTYEDSYVVVLVGLDSTQAGSCPSYFLVYKLDFTAWNTTKVAVPPQMTLNSTYQGEFMLGYGTLLGFVTTNSSGSFQANVFLNSLVGQTPNSYNASLPKPLPGIFIKPPVTLSPSKAPTRAPTVKGSPTTVPPTAPTVKGSPTTAPPTSPTVKGVNAADSVRPVVFPFLLAGYFVIV